MEAGQAGHKAASRRRQRLEAWHSAAPRVTATHATGFPRLRLLPRGVSCRQGRRDVTARAAGARAQLCRGAKKAK